MKAEYIDHMGNDLRVVNAARVSFSKESSLVDSDIEDPIISPAWYDMTGQKIYLKILAPQDIKLIEYLAKHNHWTPFSHVQISMRETVPIFVARQRFKHMVGFTYNEVSRRYVDDTPEFYHPEVWRKRAENKKQGSSDETIERFELEECGGAIISKAYKVLMDYTLDIYTKMIQSGVAPEQARMVLPQSMYTSYYVTGSLAAWARAYKLRSDPHAQMEIQELAKQWDSIISSIKGLEHSWKALTKLV